MRQVQLLQLAGVLQLCLLMAGLFMARAVEMRTHVAKLPPFLRSLFWVYFSFIGIMLAGFGVITLVSAEELAAGGMLARAIAAFLVVFWFARLLVQFFVLDARPYLTSWFYRTGYHALTLVFIYLTAVYGWVALAPAGTQP